MHSCHDVPAAAGLKQHGLPTADQKAKRKNRKPKQTFLFIKLITLGILSQGQNAD